MSTDKPAPTVGLDDLWRVVNLLNGDPDAVAAMGDIEQFEDAVRTLVGVATAHRRRLKIRARFSRPRPVRTPHLASSVDAGLERDNCRPPEDPLSNDPIDWARAFLSSGDWQDQVRTYLWFRNVMGVVAPDGHEPEDPFWDDFPTHQHGRPPIA